MTKTLLDFIIIAMLFRSNGFVGLIRMPSWSAETFFSSKRKIIRYLFRLDDVSYKSKEVN
jgi:hypothetical protein